MKDTNKLWEHCTVQSDGCFHKNYVLCFTFAQIDVILQADSTERQ